jgi:hypothetical protein
MFIEVCVLVAQKICGVLILVFAPAAVGVLPALPPKNNPAIDRQAKRMKMLLKEILRFMICSFLSLCSGGGWYCRKRAASSVPSSHDHLVGSHQTVPPARSISQASGCTQPD